MFTWICPKCGRENSPSTTECPDCEAREKAAAQALAEAPPPPAPPPPPPPAPKPIAARVETVQPEAPRYVQPPLPPPPPHYHPPPPPAPRTVGIPTWLMSIVFFLAIVGLGAAVYYGIQRFGPAGRAERAGVENPSNPSKAKPSNPLQKYIEVVGIRLMQEKKKPMARFLVVNHSNTELTDLTANVTLWASTTRSEEDSIGTFAFKLPSIGPYEAREITAPLKTKLKIYELPDWQNATAEVQITSP